MAKKREVADRFVVEDIERLFTALLPTGKPDPFGQVLEQTTAIQEDLAMHAEGRENFEEKIFDELGDIKSRTFGILFLQIFKVLRLMMGILPQGRIILIVVAVLGLLSQVINRETVSLSDIRKAAAKTGLGGFIDKLLAKIKKVADELAGEVQTLGGAAADSFAAIAIDLDTGIQSELRILQQELSRISFSQDLAEFNTTRAIMSNATSSLGARLASASNLASNADVFIGPIILGWDERIRELPELAGRLNTFGD